MFKAAGFRDIRAVSEIAEFSYATSEEWWDSLWSHGFRGPLERIEKTGGAEALAQYKAECLTQMDAVKGSQNIQQSFQVLYTVARNLSRD